MADSRNNGDFVGAAMSVKKQDGYQPIAVRPFKAVSVLDSVQGSGIGYAKKDHARQLFDGSMLPSDNGRSQTTALKRQWLDSPYKTFG